MIKTKRFSTAVVLLVISAILLTTASYAWFAMNTQTSADGLEVEAYTDSVYLQIKSDEDSEWKVNTSFAANNKKDLRLVTASLFKDSGFYSFVTFADSDVTPGTTYDSSATYYEKVASENGSGFNYVKVDVAEGSSTTGYYKNPAFTLVASNAPIETAKTYYKYDAATNSYKGTALDVGASAYGYLNLTTAPISGAEYYDGTSLYYQASGSNLVQVMGLVVPDEVTGYFVIDADEWDGSDATVEDNDYYLVSDAGDYSFIGTAVATAPTYDAGTFEAGTQLGNYLFWGRAYSTDVDDAQVDNTLSVIGSDKFGDYILSKTLQLQCAEGTINATNLVIDDVVVGGASNDLSDAIRVLFVATSSADAGLTPIRTSSALYNNSDGSITYSNGQNNLFGTVLGNEAEQITVQVYIYFDGAVDVAKNANMSGTLNAQTIEIKFGVDN